MEEHEEHEEETRTIRPRSISVYGKNGKASYVGDIGTFSFSFSFSML